MNSEMKWFLVAGLMVGSILTTCQLTGTQSADSTGLRATDAYTLVGPHSFLDGYPSRSPQDGVNVVVEIPAGTNAKWEVDKTDGALRWEFRDGKPRVVDFLGYPGNYGMIPRTLLPKEEGGDGEEGGELARPETAAQTAAVGAHLAQHQRQPLAVLLRAHP